MLSLLRGLKVFRGPRLYRSRSVVNVHVTAIGLGADAIGGVHERGEHEGVRVALVTLTRAADAVA
jgi:hypothetical protein